MIKASQRFYLKNNEVAAPVEWKQTEILATFDNEAIQPNISIDKLTFVNEIAKLIKTEFENGLIGGIGAFEGVPFKIETFNEQNNLVAFDGILDFTKDFSINDFNGKVTIGLRKKDDLYTLEERLSCLTFGYLLSIGAITTADYDTVKYIVQKKFNILETIVLAILLYMLTKELVQAIKTLVSDVVNIIAHTTGGLPTGPVAGLIYSIAIAIIDTAYTVSITVALVKVTGKLIDQLISIKRTGHCINYRKAIEKVAAHLGYGFQSNITDLSNVYYLPSNFNQDLTDLEGVISDFVGVKRGIPNITDNCYSVIDFFSEMKREFNGKFAILNGNICFYNIDDAFWNAQSSYQMPSNRDKIKTYNTDELIANHLMSFEVDYTEDYTISQYKGTSYEVITDSITTIDKAAKNIKGLKETRFNVCLAHRKDKESGIERFLRSVAAKIDSFAGSNFLAKIPNTIGIMIVSNNNYAKAKSIKMISGKLVDRSQWSARYIYENYYKGSSFINTINGIPFYGQKEVYKNVKIPFGLADFILTTNCSKIYDEQGRAGKIIALRWSIDNSYAIADYYIHQKYTANLQETHVEPDNIDI